MKLDDIVAKYIALRDRKSAMKKEYDEKVARVDDAMNKMEAIIMRVFKDSGIDSARTEAGTAYLSTRTSATVADRDTFFGWVLEDPEERVSFLENRVSKTMVDQFKAATDDLPPGLNYRSEVTVGVRRS